MLLATVFVNVYSTAYSYIYAHTNRGIHFYIVHIVQFYWHFETMIIPLPIMV